MLHMAPIQLEQEFSIDAQTRTWTGSLYYYAHLQGLFAAGA